jgi:hypothetical protein
MKEYARFKTEIEIPEECLKSFSDGLDIFKHTQNELFVSIELFALPYKFTKSFERELDHYDITKLKKIKTVELKITDLYQ